MRCLEEARPAISIDAHEVDQPGGGEDLTSPYVDGQELDVRAWARDALALALPARSCAATTASGSARSAARTSTRRVPSTPTRASPTPLREAERAPFRLAGAAAGGSWRSATPWRAGPDALRSSTRLPERSARRAPPAPSGRARPLVASVFGSRERRGRRSGPRRRARRSRVRRPDRGIDHPESGRPTARLTAADGRPKAEAVPLAHQQAPLAAQDRAAAAPAVPALPHPAPPAPGLPGLRALPGPRGRRSCWSRPRRVASAT